jgi:NAD(P)-dependent dehydrogenase (short-subunit alcohol dehydrogenase family)
MAKTYVITGGARGIGRGMAEHFVKREKARVAILDKDLIQGRSLAKRLGNALRFVPCDLADPVQIQDAAWALKPLGRLDGLINNAGISASGALEKLEVADWDMVLNVNLRAAFLCTKYFLSKLKRGASIVNIASTRALMSEPDSEAYAASKGGLLALTHAMALSLQPKGIRVNAILPGWIDVTGLQGGGKRAKISKADKAQHPAGRVGRAEDIAEAASYLMDSKRSGFVTGQQFVIDGGMTKKMIYV